MSAALLSLLVLLGLFDLLADALADVPPMPVCAICGQELDACIDGARHR